MIETEERILVGAKELFFKYGVKTITMDDIAKHLSISKKTIYQFFENKNKVVEMVMAKHLLADENEMQCISDKSKNVIEEILHLLEHIKILFTQTNPVVFYDLQKYYPSAWELLGKYKENCIEEMMTSSLVRGMKEGLIRPEINPAIITRIRTLEIEMGFNPEAFPPDKFKVAEVQTTLLEMFLHGICTIEGHQLIDKYKKIIENEQ